MHESNLLTIERAAAEKTCRKIDAQIAETEAALVELHNVKKYVEKIARSIGATEEV